MRRSDKVEHGVNVLDRTRVSSVPLTAVPIKKRRYILTRSPSPPPSPPPNVSSANTSNSPNKDGASVSQNLCQAASAASLTSKGSGEPRVELLRKDLSQSSDCGDLLRSVNHGVDHEVGDGDTTKAKELTSEKICKLLPVAEVTQLVTTKEPFKPPMKEGSVEHKHVQTVTLPSPTVSEDVKFQLASQDAMVIGQNSENISCAWNLTLDAGGENLQSKLRDGESKVESSQLYMDRSNWDLNTTMDAWHDVPSDAADNREPEKHSSVGYALNNKPGIVPNQMLYKVANGTAGTVGKASGCLSRLSMSTNDNCHPETSLDLQLKPSVMAESFFKWGSACSLDKVDSSKESLLLSLSVKSLAPGSVNCDSAQVASVSVKAEPYEVTSQRSTHNPGTDTLKTAVKHVKPEPLERREFSQGTCHSNLKSAAIVAVKSETNEGCSRGSLGKQDSLLTTQSTETVDKQIKALESCVLAGRQCLLTTQSTEMLDEHVDGRRLPNAMILQHPSETVGRSVEFVTQDLTLANIEILPGGNMASCPGIPQDEKGNVTDLLQESLVAEDLKPSLFKGKSKSMGVASSPSKHSASDIKEQIIADVKLEAVTQTCYTNGPSSSRVFSTDELSVDCLAKGTADECSEEKIELSAKVTGSPSKYVRESSNSHEESGSLNAVDNSELRTSANVLEKPSDLEKESCNSPKDTGALDTLHKSKSSSFHEEAGVVETVHKRPCEDNGYGACEEREGKRLKANCICPIDAPGDVPAFIGLNDGQTETAEESKIHDTENCDDSQSCHTDELGISTTMKSQDFSADVALMADSLEKKLNKSIHKTPSVQSKNKGPESKVNSNESLGSRTVRTSTHEEVSSLQTDHLLLDKIPLSKGESSAIDEDPDNDKGCTSRVIDLKKAPAPDGLTSGGGKCVSGRLVSPRIEKERFIENSFRRDNSQSQREEKINYRSRVLQRARNKNQQVGRRGSNLTFSSSRTESQMSIERNSGNTDVMESGDNSIEFQYSRVVNQNEVGPSGAFNGSSGNAGRVAWKSEDGLENRSHMSYRGRLPSRRGRIPIGNQMINYPAEDIRPRGYTGREVPDFNQRSRDERLTRTLPDGRMVTMVSRACAKYEREDVNLFRRERSCERSLSPLIGRERGRSPIQRRGPTEFSSICLESSPRSQLRHRQQWSPPRRSPNGFNGPPEFVGRVNRPDRMRSPRESPCFPEDIVRSRRGSPRYIDRLSDDVGDIGPSREGNFSRPARGLPTRGLQMNRRRFDLVNSQIFSEAYYHVNHNQSSKLDENVEFVDRNCNESHERRALGHGRPFRQRCAPDDANENFNSRDGGPPGPFRFRNDDNDGFRGSPGDYEGHVRNRLGGRLRDIEEQDNYRYHVEPEWCDAGMSDDRLKRR